MCNNKLAVPYESIPFSCFTWITMKSGIYPDVENTYRVPISTLSYVTLKYLVSALIYSMVQKVLKPV